MVMGMAAAPSKTRTITAAEFKAKCLQLMDEVNETGLTLIITKRGKPVMQAAAPPAAAKPFRSVVGRSPEIRILGDIVSPLPEELTLPAWAREDGLSDTTAKQTKSKKR